MLNSINMDRLKVNKTYKIFIGGKFPRTESGRYYQPLNVKGESLGNICLSSRKDLRNAVVAARKAFGPWSERTAFNRGQILYRIAEMLEGRKDQFIDELMVQGQTKSVAIKEVERSIDLCVYYAGWCDKINQVSGSINPVSTSHFNFSILEPVGVVALFAEEHNSLGEFIQGLLSIIASGNSVVIVASESMPLCAVSMAEVISTSDVPGGVVNILTGNKQELLNPACEHMDVNAIVYYGDDADIKKQIQLSAAINLKRGYIYHSEKNRQPGLHYITDCCEVKTTWHPIENIGGASSNY